MHLVCRGGLDSQVSQDRVIFWSRLNIHLITCLLLCNHYLNEINSLAHDGLNVRLHVDPISSTIFSMQVYRRLQNPQPHHLLLLFLVFLASLVCISSVWWESALACISVSLIMEGWLLLTLIRLRLSDRLSLALLSAVSRSRLNDIQGLLSVRTAGYGCASSASLHVCGLIGTISSSL